jgi:DNA/RNA endonuclease G (NUC1)
MTRTSNMRILLVMLGASSFPRSPELSALASFVTSHDALRDYLMQPEGAPLVSNKDCLDLFDNTRSWPDQEAELADWLKNKMEVSEAGMPPPSDLIVHYVGHGGLKDDGTDYCLAIRTTREDNKFYSSIIFESLWRTVRNASMPLRRYLIIDACFAGLAVHHLQAPINEAIKAKIEGLIEIDRSAISGPNTGTIALCSSSSSVTSSAAGRNGLTQFTDGLLVALRNGAPKFGAKLSLGNLHTLLVSALRTGYGDSAVMPELSELASIYGKLSDIPIFPNRAWGKRPALPPRARDASDIPIQHAIGMPTAAGKKRHDFLIARPQYTLSYNIPLGRPNWVSWHLRQEDLSGDMRAGRGWRFDPDLPRSAPHVTHADFVRGGYAVHYLCSPFDRRGSLADQIATSFISNVIPMLRWRYLKIWYKLVEHCRELAQFGWELFIQAGPGGQRGTTGNGRIVVPEFVWKIVVAIPQGIDPLASTEDARVIAVRMRNSETTKNISHWRDCQITIGALEDELGFRFLSGFDGSPHQLRLKRRVDVIEYPSSE